MKQQKRRRSKRVAMVALVALVAGMSTGLWACGNGEDTGTDGTDTGVADTGQADTGQTDTGQEDAGQQDGGEQDTGPEFTAFHESCTVTVGPGADADATTDALERAFIQAEEGSVICMVDGDYQVKRELNITEDSVTLRGQSQQGTVLDFAGQSEGANGILAQVGKDFVARDFTIKNTASDGLKVKGADGVVFKNMTVTWDCEACEENGAYALYPVECKNVLIEGSLVKNARDAGVYLGQSETAIIRDNEASGNVIGIEVENTYDAEVYNNNTHNNTNGILVINLPNLMVKGGARNIIRDNVIKDNNVENFGEEGTAVALMPPGSGLLIVTADRTEAYNNEITGNDSVGVAIVNYGEFDQNLNDPEYDVYPEGNWVHDNTLGNNGDNPRGAAAVFQVDGSVPQLLWDGKYDNENDEKDNSDGSLTNCAEGNETLDGDPVEMVLAAATEQCPEMAMGEDATFCSVNSCTHESLDSVELPQRVLDLAK